MQALGIIGGTFDPVHNGHIYPALEVAEHFQFFKLLLLPLGVAVHREQPVASSEQRLAMCHLAADAANRSCMRGASVVHGGRLHPVIKVDDREICRGGQSYSVITLEELR